MFHHSPKNLDRTITFNSVTQKFTGRTSKIFFSADKIKKVFLEIISFSSTFWKITVGGL